jgi:hypothetical protein
MTDWRSRVEVRRGVCSATTVRFSRFCGCTGFALGLGVGLGFACVFALVSPAIEAAAAFLSCNCSMRARLRATFASRSSSLLAFGLAAYGQEGGETY